MLQECGRELVKKLAYDFKKKKYNRGSLIYEQDQRSSDIYLIKKGTIELLRRISVREPVLRESLQDSSKSSMLRQINAEQNTYNKIAKTK